MARMKDRVTSPPGGWQWLETQTNWQPPAYASFDSVVTALVEHRRANSFIAKQHNLPTDYDSVANQVDEFNAERMKSNPNWNHFLGDASPPGFFSPQRLQRSAAAAVANLKKTAAGIGLIREWLGDGLRPVEQALANKRAEVCVKCPLNQEGGFWEKLDAAGAEEVKKMVAIKNDMKLETPLDSQLKSCTACLCWNSLKVWTPIAHINNHTSTKVLNELHSDCWVRKELAAK